MEPEHPVRITIPLVDVSPAPVTRRVNHTWEIADTEAFRIRQGRIDLICVWCQTPGEVGMHYLLRVGIPTDDPRSLPMCNEPRDDVPGTDLPV